MNTLDKLEEFFIWSDDKLALEDKVTELLEFDDNLRDALYNMVIKSVGTDNQSLSTASVLLHTQVQKTLKAYVEFNQESE